jgi:hypothetical protein
MHNVLGNQFYAFRGGPAWHRLGNVSIVDENIGAVDAFNRSDGAAEVDIRKFDAAAIEQDENGKWHIVFDPNEFVTHDDGTTSRVPLIIPGKAMFRGPHIEEDRARFFNIVSDDHHNLTNLEICEALDAVGVTAQWPVETMGLLDLGKAFFITLNAGEWDIKGDPMKMFLFVREGKDATRSFNIGITPVRIVCQNTERLGLDLAEINIRIPHTRGIRDSLNFYAGLLPAIKDGTERIKAARSRLAEFKVSQDQAKEVFAQVWEYPTEPQEVRILNDAADTILTEDQLKRLTMVKERHERNCGYQDRFREAAVNLLEQRNDEIQPRELAGTAHVVFNTITEMENYRRGHGNTNTVESILQGSRQAAMTRGFKALVALN